MNDDQKRHLFPWILAAVVLIVFFGNLGDLGIGFALPVMILLIVAATVVLRGPLGRAIARRLESGPTGGTDPMLVDEVVELRGRMLELEERLDFAERLLAQTREMQRIDGA